MTKVNYNFQVITFINSKTDFISTEISKHVKFLEQKISHGNSMYKDKKYPLSLGLDHPSVQKVIDIATELTKEHKLINTDLLYNRAKKNLKIPSSGLKTIIQMLINKKILIDGSRFTKKTILKNKFRFYIFKTIKMNLGVHFSLLKEACSTYKDGDIGVGHLVWHLEKLISFNLIKKIKINKYTIFLPNDVDDDVGILYFFLRDDLNRKIMQVLLDSYKTSRADIYKDLEEDREKIYYRIKKLIEYGLIDVASESKNQITIIPSKKNLIRDVIINILNEVQKNTKKNLISMKVERNIN